MLPTDRTPTDATMAAVVTATLNAGAVPAMPIIADSKVPSDPLANSPCVDTIFPRTDEF
jgi:hypothetical protein